MENKAKDFLGQDIKIGDKVVFCQLGYRNFMRGVITKITDKMLFIDYTKHNSPYNSKQSHDQVIKIKQ